MVLLVLAVLIAAQEPATDERLASLVARLGSEDLESREKAQAELYALGPDIKLKLEKFLAANSGEAAKRIRSVLDRFEWDRFFKELVPPVARITLDRKRRTPEEVFAVIKEKTGWNIRAAAMNLREPVELGWTDAPALQVVDDVCRALGRGRVQLRAIAGGQSHERYSYDSHGRKLLGRAEERIVSIDGNKPPAAWVTYSNQFRAELEDIVITETRDYNASKGNASIRLVLAGQPEMTSLKAGAWIIDEIVDDKGRSLKSDAKPPRFGNEQPESELGESRDSVWFSSRDHDHMMMVRSQVPIAVPESDAVRIAQLKARIRVTFPGREITKTRKVEEVRESGEIRIGGAVITILQAEVQGQRFTVRYRLAGRYQGQPAVELLDERGQPANQSGYSGGGGGGGEWSYSWNLRGAAVAQIRVRAQVGHKTIEVPVEMKDIPLPKGE
jgi:hypothetical protein